MSASVFFVDTKAIKLAVKDREAEVLSVLDIRWDTGGPHITCLYPEHGGTNDWRWDAKKKLAFCTCNKPGTADSIFDVVMKCEGLADFAASKLRMTELLGQPGLVKQKGAADKSRQRQDVDALLHPPADQHDDGLAQAYLACFY